MKPNKNIENILPLSPLQGGILFHALYMPETRVYFEQFMCRLSGAVDRKAFADTWQLLIDRHPILRTGFVTKSKREPVQVVFRQLPFTVQELDWTGQNPAEQAERLAQYLAHDQSLGFAFNRPPLTRVALIQLASDSWQLIWSHHHILLDGWSLTLMMDEFLTVYKALASGSQPQLVSRRGYGDYLTWLGKQDLREAESFWREYLADFTHPTPLGIDRHFATGGVVKQKHHLDSFTPAETARIDAFAREHRLTPSTLFQAAWALLLNRYSGEDDIVFGVTLSGRAAPLPGIEQMIGMFINTLPMRIRTPRNQRLGAWLREIQSRNMDLQQYEYCSLTDIHRWCPVAGGQRLFDSLLVFENYPIQAPPATADLGLRIENVELIESTHFPLSAVVVPGHSLRLKISFDENRIPTPLAEQLSGHLRSLVMQMVEGADLPLAAFKLPVTPPIAPAPYEDHSSTAQTLWDRFAEAAARHHSRVAISFGGEQWTYARLAEESSRLARSLARLGVRAESRVGICMERSPQQIIAMLGVIQAGGAYVPLDPAYPTTRLAFMAADSACLLILTTTDLKSRLENLNRAILCIEDCESDSTSVGQTGVCPDNAAYVIYTSGSTGDPKGVLITHRNVLRLFAATGEHFQFIPGDVWTYFHSFSFDFSVWEIWGALLHGARLVIVPYFLSRDPAAFYRLLVREGVTVLNQTPSAFYQLLGCADSKAKADALSLRYIIFGGEALDLQSLRPWFERHSADHTRVINMYGITETTVHVTHRRIVPEDLLTGSVSLIGQALSDLKIHLLDEYGHPVPTGVRGEICISGQGLARGYLNNPDATAAKFSPNPLAVAVGERLYRSGDLARRLSDGDLEYCGRSDYQIKVRGHRIEVGEISAALSRNESIREAFVRVYTDDNGQTRLAAYAVCSSERKPGVEELRSFLQQYLPDYMLPEAFIFCDSFPLTINGKLDVEALPAPQIAREGLEEEYVAPANPVERQLAEIWQSVLGVDSVGRNDNFFALGGDSIRSITIMSLAADKGIVFNIQQLFEHQTIARLVETMTGESAVEVGALAPDAFGLVHHADVASLPPDLEDAYPLARLQAGMLFRSDFGDGSQCYQDAFSFRLRLHFDEPAWLTALESMIADHPILRTSFHFADLRQPLQYVHPSAPTPLDVYDLRDVSEEAQNAYLKEWIETQVKIGFEWERPPLFRCFIHRLRDDVVELSFIVHHAILDGWSAATFFKELAERYLHLLNPSAARPAPGPKKTYREFIALEMGALASESQRKFWGEMLADLPRTKIHRWGLSREADSKDVRGGYRRWSLSPALSEKILSIARDAQLPVKSLLLAVHLRVLRTLTGSDEVITGLVSNGRPGNLDGTRVLGLFLNTVPFRFRIPNCSWLALCQAALGAETKLLPYRLFPLSEISRMNGNSLPFETSFNFVNFHVYDGLKDRAEIQLLETGSIEQVDIPLSANFSLGVSDGSLHFGLMYNPSEFSAAQADSIAAYYERALSTLAEAPLAPHADADLLSDEERRQLFYISNANPRPLGTPLFIHQRVEQQAAQTPSAIAVICSGRQWSYAELNGKATRLARLILSSGARPDAPIAVMAHRSFDMVCALLAILKAGCAYVPVDSELPENRIAAILQDVGSPLILTQELLLERIPHSYAGSVIVFEKSEHALSSFSEDMPHPSLNPANLAYILFTSGSTGRPKGVAITHEGLTNHMQWMEDAFPLSADDIVFQKTSYSFDASVWEFWAPLMAGAKLLLARPGGQQDPAYLVEEIQKQKVTVLQLVPSMLEVLLEEPGFAQCGTLRTLFVGGEALKTPVSRECRRLLGIPLVNLYGPTEATIQTSAAIITEAEAGSTANIGRPIFNTRYFILDQNMQPVPPGVMGELYIGGLCLARGYWNAPDLTAERFIPDPLSGQSGQRLYRTGDLVRYSPQGSLECLGRVDRQYKLHGFRVEMADIESALKSFSSVTHCAVTVQKTRQDDARLIAYYEASPGTNISTQDIRRHLQALLPPYMIPAIFHRVEQWPLLPNGKTDFAALPLPAPDLESPDRVLREASTEKERSLADIWLRLLGVDQISIDDSFFDLGGDSILSLQIVAQSRKQGLDFTPQELFNNPTIAELALVARDRKSTSPEPFSMSGEVPLTPVQRFFFEQNIPNAHHWNQAVLLEVSSLYSAGQIRQALARVVERHDAFHLRFHQEEDRWRQVYGDARTSFAFDEIDLRPLPEPIKVREYEAFCNRAQSSLNLAAGPLIRAAYIRLDNDEAARLLIVCHHLIIDGVSWRILLEDLHTCLEHPNDAPGATLPFGAWARKLTTLPLSEIAQAEGEFWKRHGSLPVTPLPVDYPGSVDKNTYESAAVMKMELTVEETEALLVRAPRNLRASVAEVLLACLTETITAWTGGNELFITLEGHGRESLIADADISRCIGWFTSLYPLRLESRPGSTLTERLAAAKRQARKVPNNGVGYGLIRYMYGDEDLARHLADCIWPQISLNYLGQFDNSFRQDAPFKAASESTGNSAAPASKRSSLLEVVALIADGRLILQWVYSRKVHHADTITRLARASLLSLKRFAEAAQTANPACWITEDFQLARLSDAEFDEVISSGRPFEELWPLSPVQEGMLFHTLEEGVGSGVYVQQLTGEIRGRCDIALLEKSWQIVLQKDANLRVTFAWEELRHPLQKIVSHPAMPFALLDWREFSTAEQRQMLGRVFVEDRAAGFDLKQAPLMRVTLIRLGDEAWHLLWTHHHILLDGWSLPLILSQVVSAYRALSAGLSPRLASGPPYSHYLAWLQRQDRAEAETFWRDYLAGYGEPTVVASGNESTSAARQPQQFDQCESMLSESLSDRLRGFAQKRKLTVNNIVQAAWGFVLSRHIHADEVVYGITVSGRPATLPGVEDMVGLFINTLPLRVKIHHQQPIGEWLTSAQASQSELLRFQHSRLIDIAGWSEIPRGKPLFDTILVFENYPIEEALRSGAGEFSLEQLTAIEQNHYPLTLYVTPGREFKFSCSYQPNRLLHLAPDVLLSHLRRVIRNLIERGDGNVSDLELVSASERKQILEAWNDTATDYDREMLVPARFTRAAALDPHKLALTCGSEQVSYGELEQDSNRLARFLRELGVGPESRVAILFERTPRMVYALLAALKSGAAYVPLDPSFPRERLRRIIDQADPHLILTSSDLTDSLPETQARVISLDTDWAEVARMTPAPVSVVTGPENLAYLIFTSGSTGEPKGVQITHAALLNILESFRRRPGLSPQDVFVAVTTISFDIAALEIFLPLLVGATLTLAPRETAASGVALAGLLQSSGATAMQATPITWRMLLAVDWKPRQGFRAWCGGEMLPGDLAAELLTRCGALWNLYGPTETTIWSTIHEVRDGQSASLIGRPIANTRAYVLDDAGNLLPPGVAGQLHLGGDGLTRGYLKLAELTAEKLIPDPYSQQPGARLYRTGDLARFTGDGELEYLGRMDLQTKIDGFRIELGDVEAAMRSLPGIHQAAATVARDERNANRFVGYLVYQPSQSPYEVSRLREMMLERVPAYMVPQSWVVLETLPLTPNNKLDRKALLATARHDEPKRYLAPRTSLESALVEIWKEAFQRDDIGVDDNFFDLGGHSLIGTQIHVKVIKIFQVELPLRELFRSPTIESLAACVMRREAAPGRSDKVARAYLAVKRMTPEEKKRMLTIGAAATDDA